MQYGSRQHNLGMIALYRWHLEYLIFHNPSDKGIPFVEHKLSKYIKYVK